jgi:uncharacterized membrane protein
VNFLKTLKLFSIFAATVQIFRIIIILHKFHYEYKELRMDREQQRREEKEKFAERVAKGEVMVFT